MSLINTTLHTLGGSDGREGIFSLILTDNTPIFQIWIQRPGDHHILMTKSGLSVPSSRSHQTAEGGKECLVVVQCDQLLREGRGLRIYVAEGSGAFLSLQLLVNR